MKIKTSVSVDKTALETCQRAGVVVSQVMNDAVVKEAKRIQADAWIAENQPSMNGFSKFIEEHGSLSDMYRDDASREGK